MTILTADEAVEIENFKERRKVFGGNLSVKDVHNVATYFPNMYTRIFHTNSLDTDLFCIGDGFDHLYIWITNNTITIDDHCEGQILTEDSFPIKFCPICGRKLNEQFSK